MPDARVEKLAEVLVNYSLEIRPNDLFLISAETTTAPLVREVVRLAARRGAHPVLRLALPGVQEIVLKESPEEALDWVSPLAEAEIEQITAQLTIWGEANTHELSGAPPACAARARKAQSGLSRRFRERSLSHPPEVRWCGTLFPVQALAQDAHMSLADYENFVYHAMLLDTPDPLQAWRDFSVKQEQYRNTSLDLDEEDRSAKRNKFGGTKYVYSPDVMKTMRRWFEREIARRFPQNRIVYWT